MRVGCEESNKVFYLGSRKNLVCEIETWRCWRAEFSTWTWVSFVLGRVTTELCLDAGGSESHLAFSAASSLSHQDYSLHFISDFLCFCKPPYPELLSKFVDLISLAWTPKSCPPFSVIWLSLLDCGRDFSASPTSVSKAHISSFHTCAHPALCLPLKNQIACLHRGHRPCLLIANLTFSL